MTFRFRLKTPKCYLNDIGRSQPMPMLPGKAIQEALLTDEKSTVYEDLGATAFRSGLVVVNSQFVFVLPLPFKEEFAALMSCSSKTIGLNVTIQTLCRLPCTAHERDKLFQDRKSGTAISACPGRVCPSHGHPANHQG